MTEVNLLIDSKLSALGYSWKHVYDPHAYDLKVVDILMYKGVVIYKINRIDMGPNDSYDYVHSVFEMHKRKNKWNKL